MLQVAVLPAASVTTNVFVVVPTGNAEPLAKPAVCAMLEPGQLSLNGTLYVTTAVHKPASLFTVILLGHVKVGFSLSFTVTVKLQVAVLPAASVTTNVFVVVPLGNAEPLAKPAVCAMLEPGQLSLNGTLYVTTAVHKPASLFTVILLGHVKVGFSLSFTILHYQLRLP
jgi:hypothetical protein